MIGRGRCTMVIGLCVLAALLTPGCEKETHRAARREYQEIRERHLPDDAMAAALESFVHRYPEPKTNPNLARACGWLAGYHARSGRAELAASWYERALRVDPDDPDLLNALGYHYARSGLNLDRAVAVLEKAVSRAEALRYPERRRGLILDSLGWAYRRRGDLPQAVATLEEACRLAPGVPILKTHLADTYHALGERDKAVATYLEVYRDSRATDLQTRVTLEALAREAGPSLSQEVARRLQAARRDIAQEDRRQAEADGAQAVGIGAADGVRIAGSLYLPPGRPTRAAARRRPIPGVILLHALGSNRHDTAPVARLLAAAGMAVLAIDLRGHGGSASEAFPSPHLFSEHLAENIRLSGSDAVTALAYLARRPEVDAARLGGVGAGLGGLLALRALAAPPAPAHTAIVLLSPWGSAGAYLEPLQRLEPASVLIVSSAQEGPAASLLERIAQSRDGIATRSVPEPGSGFGLLGASPALGRSVVDFVAGRLR
jgi:dienelactone hydrolase/Flp pilus assembly protein TadD